jgi:hypothetical protein
MGFLWAVRSLTVLGDLLQENRFSGARLEVAELRRYSGNNWPWVYRKILPQKAETALQGTSLAAYLTNYLTHLYFQEHSGKVVEYIGSYEEWTSKSPFCTIYLL